MKTCSVFFGPLHLYYVRLPLLIVVIAAAFVVVVVVILAVVF